MSDFPIEGYGWSDPTASIGGSRGSSSSSIVGPSKMVGTNGSVRPGYGGGVSYNTSQSNSTNNKISTPIDPLIKYLKREYASSAGPQDVLASSISVRDLEFLLNETTATSKSSSSVSTGSQSSMKYTSLRRQITPSQSRLPPPVISMTDTTTVGRGINERDIPLVNIDTWGRSSSLDTDNSNDINQPQQQQQQDGLNPSIFDRSATPLASGAGGTRPSRASSTTSLNHPEQHSALHIAATHHAQQQQKRRSQMPSFCFSSPSHIDNLLQTTPYLRHLSITSTDMSGEGKYDESKNVFAQLFQVNKGNGDNGAGGGSRAYATDYHTSVMRQNANRRASLELASFMRLLSNEMPQETFDAVEAEVYSKVFALVHSKAVRSDDRLAGVAALDALLSVPSADEERRAIRFGNNLSNGLKSTSFTDYEFLHAIARALGRMAMGAANIDRVEFEIGRSLEWLRSDRSDRRLAAVLVLRELARCAPAAFYSKTQNVNVHHHASVTNAGPAPSATHLAGLGGTNDFLDNIMPVLRDPQPIVRVCAADALSECLVILMNRQQHPMIAPLCTLFTKMMEGLTPPRSSDRPQHIDANTYEMTAAVNAHGSLLVVSEMLKHSGKFIVPRFDEVCVAVLKLMKHKLILIRLEVIRLIPRLAQRCPEVYGRRYLGESLDFLIANASTTRSMKSRIDVKSTAFKSIGQLAIAMSDESMGGGDIMAPSVRITPFGTDIPFPPVNNDVDYHLVELKEESDFQERLEKIFSLISYSLKNQHKHRCNLGCFANFVEALGIHADVHVMGIVDDMFESGLSEDLIMCLHSIMRSLPSKQLAIERRLFEEVSTCLAGKALDLFTIRRNTRPTLDDAEASTTSSVTSLSTLGNIQPNAPLERNFMSSMSLSSMNPSMRPQALQSSAELDAAQDVVNMTRTEEVTVAKSPALSSRKDDRVVINKSTNQVVVNKIVLSLQTLRSIGESYMLGHASDDGNMLLPFLRNVISQYFEHPSSNVRQEAAFTCCLLLLPFEDRNKENESPLRFKFGDVSGELFEEVLQKLLRMAVSDVSPVVRLCIVRGLDERYDLYLSLNQGSPLFLMLEDEALAVRAGALQILGRLSRLNPAPILPGLRQVLIDLLVELNTTSDGGGREVATRLIILFLREEALQRLTRPFISSIIDALPLVNVAPRLATASLEALGEVATVSHTSISPFLRQLVVENIQDPNTSKQRVSLWSLGKIAFGTNYVISPYLDYPQLLSQASDILPTTKKAPWELRREVFRTFGILGALDPDRFSSDTKQGGGKGGGYFAELEDEKDGAGRTKLPTDLSSSLQSMNRSSSAQDLQLLPSNCSTDALNEQRQDSEGLSTAKKDSDDDEPAHLYMYEQYAMTAQPISKLSPRKRLSPSDEAFYPTVAVQALMRILTDSSLSNLHGMVMKAVMFIFNALGMKSVPFLKTIVPHILATVKNCGQHGLREALLQQISTLSAIVREYLRPYLPAIFDVISEFWLTRHLAALCSLVERVATAVPDDFRAYVPLLVRQALDSIDSIDLAELTVLDINRLELILQHIQGIKNVLGEHIHLVVPSLVQLIDSLINPDADGNNTKGATADRISPQIGSARSKVTIEAIDTLSILLQTVEVNPNVLIDTSVKSNSSLPARVVQPFLRILGSNVRPNQDVGSALIGCLCVCVRQLGAGRWLSFYHEMARETIFSWQTKLGIQQEEEQSSSEIITTVSLLPIQVYDEVVNEITSLSNARWDMWNVAEEEDVSGSDFSLGRSGQSEVSLTRLVGEREDMMKSSSVPSIHHVESYQTTHKTNLTNLQKAWDVSQRTTREDWDEWMRRFSVQLLREAPSPALRACAELAQAYQPLARELFSAGFVCCWSELTDQYRSNLKFSLEVVFSADASLEILQLLLNLAEFMELSFPAKGKIPGLNIDISILAELALKCRAYARALHYKEREYIMGRGGSCVEQLIDINKKLDLPEAALGVLKAAKIEIERRGGQTLASSPTHRRANSALSEKSLMSYSVITSYEDESKGNDSWAGDMNYESWLAKLGSWAEAVGMYEEKLRENPHDPDSLLGCLQCYIARGDWQKALDLAGRSWGALSGVSLESISSPAARKSSSSSDDNYNQALKFCAQSAWRLGKWDELETFSAELVQGNQTSSNSIDTTSTDFDGAFYQSVLHIHREEWGEAAKSIDFARKAMDSRFTALLSESYKRAYPSMVDAQELSELEEIISFRQFEKRKEDGKKLHSSANHSDTSNAREHLLNVWRQRLDGCRVDADVHSSILAVRSLVLGPTDEVDATITLSALSRQAEAFRLAERTLLDPLAKMNCSLNSPVFGVGIPANLGLGISDSTGESMERIVNGDISVHMKYKHHHDQFSKQLFAEAGGEERLFIQHKLYFAYTKHLWATNKREEAMTRLGLLCNVVDLTTQCTSQCTTQCGHGTDLNQREALRMNCWLRYGDWRIGMLPLGAVLADELAADVLSSYKRATDAATGKESSYKAYHSWALINFRLAEQINPKWTDRNKAAIANRTHVIAAVKAFVRAISVGTKRFSASVQQDMLNLLDCLYNYAEVEGIATAINDGLSSIKT